MEDDLQCSAVRRGEQPPWIVSDGLWQRIEPLLPRPQRNPRYPGRKRIADRQVLCGILFVLYTGIQWEFLPQELGFGSGMTCWRRLAEWNRAGVWQRFCQSPRSVEDPLCGFGPPGLGHESFVLDG